MLIVQWLIIIVLVGLVLWLVIDTILYVIRRVKARKQIKKDELNKDKTE